jgi:hypothetical protein
LSRRGIAIVDVLAAILDTGGALEKILLESRQQKSTDIVATFSACLDALFTGHALIHIEAIGTIDVLVNLVKVERFRC